MVGFNKTQAFLGVLGAGSTLFGLGAYSGIIVGGKLKGRAVSLVIAGGGLLLLISRFSLPKIHSTNGRRPRDVGLNEDEQLQVDIALLESALNCFTDHEEDDGWKKGSLETRKKALIEVLVALSEEAPNIALSSDVNQLLAPERKIREERILKQKQDEEYDQSLVEENKKKEAEDRASLADASAEALCKEINEKIVELQEQYKILKPFGQIWQRLLTAGSYEKKKPMTRISESIERSEKGKKVPKSPKRVRSEVDVRDHMNYYEKDCSEECKGRVTEACKEYSKVLAEVQNCLKWFVLKECVKQKLSITYELLQEIEAGKRTLSGKNI